MADYTKQTSVICAVDFEHNSLAAEKLALICARAMKTDVTYCHTFFESNDLRNAALSGGFAVPPAVIDSIQEKVEAEKQEQLRWRIAAIGAKATDSDIHTHIGFGDAVQEINQHIKNQHPRLLVISKKRRSFFSEFLLGSIGNRILRDCAINTLIVPDDENIFLKGAPQKCMVALSFEEGSQNVWRQARALATSLGAKLKIVHVALSWEELNSIGKDTKQTEFGAEVQKLINDYERKLEQKIENFCKTMDIDRKQIEIELHRGSIDTEIFRSLEKNQADLVVIGSNDARKSHLKTLGSVASSIARSARYPVFVVHETSHTDDKLSR